MRLLWATDIHLSHLKVAGASRRFGEYLRDEQDFDAVLLTGDIATHGTLRDCLGDFAKAIGCRVYFVLGNHDYYDGSVASTRKLAVDLTEEVENLVWLDAEGVVLLDEQTALVGVGGWYNARTGNPEAHDFEMSDWYDIEDLRLLTNYEIKAGIRQPIVEVCRRLADAAAKDGKRFLEEALKQRKDVLFATHYPPFPQAHLAPTGRQGDSTWSPWFVSVAMGEMLAEVAEAHPDNRITVLCGHTHTGTTYQHFDNLVVRVGSAKYGIPDVEDVFELPIKWKSV